MERDLLTVFLEQLTYEELKELIFRANNIKMDKMLETLGDKNERG